MHYSIIHLGLTLIVGVSLPLSGLCAEPKPQEKAAALETAIKSSASRKEKADACRQLAIYGRAQSVPALVALLGDEQLSHMARYALETIPGAAIDEALRDSLGNVQGRPLVGVITSLGVRRDGKAVKPLSALLISSDAEVAAAAARALGDIGTTQAARELEEALPKAPAGVQLAFAEGLLRCAEAAVGREELRRAAGIYGTLDGIGSPHHQVRAAALRGLLLTSGNKAPAMLSGALQSQDFGRFLVAARASHELRGAEVTQVLIGEWKNASEDKQVVLAQTLAKRRDASAVPALEAAARKGTGLVCLAAIRALPELGSSTSAQLLADLMNSNEAGVAEAAQEALAALQGSQVDLIVTSMLTGSDTAKHIKGLELVSRRRMTASLHLLFKDAAHPDDKVRVPAVKTIGELAGPTDLMGVWTFLRTQRPRRMWIRPSRHSAHFASGCRTRVTL
jgi:HEAT repeat protein